MFIHKYTNFKFIDITGMCVDDSLSYGDKHFWEFITQTKDKFKSRDREIYDTVFAGVRSFVLTLDSNLRKINTLKTTHLTIRCYV